MPQLAKGCNVDLSSNGISREDFPADFTFGTSSAAYQVMLLSRYSSRLCALCVSLFKSEAAKFIGKRAAVACLCFPLIGSCINFWAKNSVLHVDCLSLYNQRIECSIHTRRSTCLGRLRGPSQLTDVVSARGTFSPTSRVCTITF